MKVEIELSNEILDKVNLYSKLQSDHMHDILIKAIHIGLDSLLEKKGRGRRAVDYPPDWIEVYSLWRNNEYTAIKAMDILNLKRTTFYKLVKKYEKGEKDEI